MRRQLLLAEADAAIWWGHTRARLGQLGDKLLRITRNRRDWKLLRVGPIEIQTPPDWGDVEAFGDSGYVIHNQPAWARVDGDAVWYGNAIEIRLEPEANGHLAANPAMAEEKRTLEIGDQTWIATLCIANGVGSSRRRVARHVLSSISISQTVEAIFPDRDKQERGDNTVQTPCNEEPRVAVDFLKQFNSSKRLEGSRLP